MNTAMVRVIRAPIKSPDTDTETMTGSFEFAFVVSSSVGGTDVVDGEAVTVLLGKKINFGY